MTARAVLVVDDEPDVAELIAGVAAALGFTVRTAGSGAAFKARYAEQVPDVVVLDVLMPDADGLELTRWLIAEGWQGRLVVISGYDPRYLRAAEAFASARGQIEVHSLQKPVKLAALRAALGPATA